MLGNDETYPAGGEEYEVSEMLLMPFDQALVNPDTFATVAVGYDYTLHSDPENGWRVEFYMGYTTQG